MNFFKSEDDVIVSLSVGKLKGRVRETSRKMEFLSFTKIPYAKPPIGNRRFLRPEPYGSWSGILDATKPCSRPVQFVSYWRRFRRVVGTEDCLHLNVYTPDLPVTENQRMFPVLVYLYGGRFVFGEATERFYFPKPFIETGKIVVVTVNYRLGPLGFLSLRNDLIPGNQGLWDQRLALEWVRDHIAYFGGDPNQVTLMGHDAGSVSVSYHLASTLSGGLFHSAVCASGTFISSKFTFDFSDSLLDSFLLHCGLKPEERDRKMLQKLQKLSLPELYEATLTLRDKMSSTEVSVNPWVPISDSQFCDTPFLRICPTKTIAEGLYNKMPVIVGTSEDSGLAVGYTELRHILDRINRDWSTIGGEILMNGILNDVASDKIKRFYSDKDGNIDSESLLKMLGDAVFQGANERFVTLLQKNSAQPVYVYRFDHSGTCISIGDFYSLSQPLFLTKWIMDKLGIRIWSEKRCGVSHWDEILYLFNNKTWKNDKDRNVAEVLVNLIVNFASSGGNPTPKQNSSELKKLLWEPIQSSKPSFLSVSSIPEVKWYDTDLKLRMEFWNRMYKDLGT